MTTPLPEQLISPAEQFLLEGGDPFATPDQPWEKPDDSDSNWKVYLALAAGFLVVRAMLKDRAQRQQADNISSIEAFIPVLEQQMAAGYAAEFSPAFRVVYAEAPDPGPMADAHAAEVGRMLAEVSARALREGFHAGLNTGLVPQVAWARATEALGLDSRQMRQWLPSAAGDGYTPSLIAENAVKVLDRMLWQRADRVAENEVFVARTMARQARWMWWQATGRIPKTARKQWVTKDDERVCQVCGPLHRQTQPLSKPFIVGDAKVWNSGLHPNCRCRIELVVPSRVRVTLRKEIAKAERRVASQAGVSRYGQQIGEVIRADQEVATTDAPAGVSWRDLVPPPAQQPQQAPPAPARDLSLGSPSQERDLSIRAAEVTPQAPWWLQEQAQEPVRERDLSITPAGQATQAQERDLSITPAGQQPQAPERDLSITPAGQATSTQDTSPSILNQYEQTTYLAEPIQIHYEERSGNADHLLRIADMDGTLPGHDVTQPAPYFVESLDPEYTVGRVVNLGRMPTGSLLLEPGDHQTAVTAQMAERLRDVAERTRRDLAAAEESAEGVVRGIVAELTATNPAALGDDYREALDRATKMVGSMYGALEAGRGDMVEAEMGTYSADDIRQAYRGIQNMALRLERAEEMFGGGFGTGASLLQSLVEGGAGDPAEEILLHHIMTVVTHRHPELLSEAEATAGVPVTSIRSDTEHAEDLLRELRQPVVLRFRGWTGQNAPNNPNVGQATGYYKITDVQRRPLGQTAYAPEKADIMGILRDETAETDLIDMALRMDAVTEITLVPIDEDEFLAGVELGDDVPDTSPRGGDPGAVQEIMRQARHITRRDKDKR